MTYNGIAHEYNYPSDNPPRQVFSDWAQRTVVRPTSHAQ